MDTLQQAVDYLLVHGQDIGKAAREGNELCERIVRLYAMVHSFQCNGSIGLLLGALDEYKQVRFTL